jgi:hypothetical protein
MAQAGYCSECGRNVYLNSQGACPEGHGADCISNTYEVPDAGEGAPEESLPVTTPETSDVPEGASEPLAEVSAPETPPVVPVVSAYPATGLPVAPQRNRTGLVVIIIAAVLILGACLATGLLLGPTLQKTGTSSSSTPARAKVQTTIGFLHVLFGEDAFGIKPYLTDAAQNAVTGKQWQTIASAIATVQVTFGAPKWSSAAPPGVGVSSEGSPGAVELGSDEATSAPVVNLLLTASGTTSKAAVTLVKVGSDWRIVSVAGETGEKTMYDAAFVKNLADETSASVAATSD